MTGFEKLSTADLRTLILNVKRGLQDILTMDRAAEDARRRTTKGASPTVEFFWLDVFLLTTMEKEVMSRKMDPRHPAFGPDVLGLVADMQAGLILSGESAKVVL